MTWYDGGPAPDPTRRDPAPAAPAGRATARWEGAVDDDEAWRDPVPRRRLRAVPAQGEPGLDALGPDPAGPDAFGPGGDGFGPDPAGIDGFGPGRAVADGFGPGPVPRGASWPGSVVDDGASRRSTRRDVGGAGPAGRARLRVAAEAASAAARASEPPAADQDGAASTGADRVRLLDALRWRIPSRAAFVALAALVLVGGAVALRAAAQPTGEPVTVEEPAVVASASPQPGPTVAEAATVWVHVVGQVAAPGVVALPAGSRVGEAVAAVGGALPDADLAGLNLAAVVEDGAQVRVPAPGEAGQAEPAEPAEAAGGAGSTRAGGAVDVNTADAGELQTLPGIGPVLAERIVAWRTEHGAFADVDALRDVPGIGPAVLSQIEALVRV